MQSFGRWRNSPPITERGGLLPCARRVCHRSLLQPHTSHIQYKPSYAVFFRSILILLSCLHLGLSSGLFLSDLETKIWYSLLISQTYCHVYECDHWRGFGLDIGFIDHLQVVTTNNYNTIADFHTLQITRAHAVFQSAGSSLVVAW
jgi:hypothetical protein